MRTVFIASLLALALIISASAAPRAVTTSTCCSKFFKGKIPAGNVASYGSTSSDCPKKALLFTTVKGKVFCVEPDQDWVKSFVEKKERAEATTARSNISDHATTPRNNISDATTPRNNISDATTPRNNISDATTPQNNISGATTPRL